jgi:hypothetical protein
MKQTKCKACGRYETREKQIGLKKLNVAEDIEIPVFHFWKWCKLNNNWCRNVAGNCGAVIKKAEEKLEGETNEIL